MDEAVFDFLAGNNKPCLAEADHDATRSPANTNKIEARSALEDLASARRAFEQQSGTGTPAVAHDTLRRLGSFGIAAVVAAGREMRTQMVLAELKQRGSNKEVTKAAMKSLTSLFPAGSSAARGSAERQVRSRVASTRARTERVRRRCPHTRIVLTSTRVSLRRSHSARPTTHPMAHVRASRGGRSSKAPSKTTTMRGRAVHSCTGRWRATRTRRRSS